MPTPQPPHAHEPVDPGGPVPIGDVIPEVARDLIRRTNDPQYGRWLGQVHATGGCAQPVRLRGHVKTFDRATGELLRYYSTRDEPDGVLRVACKNRRASRCPACAEVYRGDTYQLIRAGLVGGKGVPDAVADHPRVFATLTAPGFGAVHARRIRHGKLTACHPRRDAGTCQHGRPVSCTRKHPDGDPAIGQPICPDCYDYSGAVLFNAAAPELWRRFAITLRRRLAAYAGLTQRAFNQRVRVAYAKVAEYQKRGVVHFHAVIRLDGVPDDPVQPPEPPPAWATTDLLDAAIRDAATAVSLTVGQDDTTRELAWGTQVDVRPITTRAFGDGDPITDQAVAGYIAKYATKAAETTGTLDQRINSRAEAADAQVPDHARRMITTCLDLAECEGLADLRLADWAHMLGFRGHFSTKTRRYSTTLGALRLARTDHQAAERTGMLFGATLDEPTTLVVAHWSYVGQGHSPGDALLARQAVTDDQGRGR